MDELEEVMRIAGEQLREAEALVSRAWERPQWRARQRDAADPEILRRALDIPFLRDLVRIAWRVGPEADVAVRQLRERGYQILVCDHAPDAVPLTRVRLGEKVAVVFGSEQLGVSEGLKAAADDFFYLPSSGFTSYLNVSVAAGISLHTLDDRISQAGHRAPLEADDRARLRRAWYAALARGDNWKARRFLGWLVNPPAPAPDTRTSSPYMRRRPHGGRGRPGR
jgi:hypothetical protein